MMEILKGTTYAACRRAFMAFALCASAAGCAPAETEIHSYVDPEFSATDYHRLLVAPRYEDLGLRNATEAAFLEAMDATDAAAVASMGFLPPTREVTNDELFALLTEQSIDAVLLLEIVDAYQDRAYVPERVDIDTDEFLTARQFRAYGGRGAVHGYYRTRVTRSGGYYVDLPRMRVALKLYDATTKRMAWYATALTSGDSSATADDMARSLARETVERLTADGLLSARPDPKDRD